MSKSNGDVLWEITMETCSMGDSSSEYISKKSEADFYSD